MPPDHPGFKQFYEHYGKLMVATFAEHASTVMQMIQNDRKLRGFGHGSEKINKKTFALRRWVRWHGVHHRGLRAPAPDDPRTMGTRWTRRTRWRAWPWLARCTGLQGQCCGEALGAEEQARQRHPLRLGGGPVPADDVHPSARALWTLRACSVLLPHPRGPVRPAPRCRRSWEALRRLHRCRLHPSLLPLWRTRCACSAHRSSGSVSLRPGVRIPIVHRAKPHQSSARAALMLDLPKGIGGVVTSSPAGSGSPFW